MKNKRRLISLLLAIAVLTGIAILAVSADGAVKISNIGSTGNLSGIPAVVDSGDITYLSDIYDTSAKKYSYVMPGSDGVVRDFTLDQNFFGTRVYPFYGAADSKRLEVKKGSSKVDADGYRVLNNGVKVHYSDIALGRDATIFDKGLAFQPSTVDADNQATVIFDVSALDADYFYAVAGMTGEGNKSSYQRKIDFELYGSKDTTYSESMSFEKLAYAEGICAWLMGEFNIPIKDYNFIKLVAVTKKDNTAAESVWADACVYKLPTTTAEASIVWDDTYNPETIRPDGDLTVQLYADGVAVEGKTAVLNAANNWKASFTDLDLYHADLVTEISYTVGIATDPAMHRMVSNENGVITYQYDATLTTKDIPVSLVWDETAAPDQSARPESVVVQLYADGVAQEGKTVTLNADGDWKSSFLGVAEKKRLSATETVDIVYTFKVLTRTNNYSSKITENTDGVVVTMTYQESVAVKFSNIGKSGTLSGIPSAATGSNTHYLTDLFNGRNNRVISQFIVGDGSYRSFVNYEDQVQVIYGGGAKQQLVDSTTTINGITYQPTDIVLGANGTIYKEGLSFMVSAPSADDTYITYDLTGMNATNFYAVAGITGTANDLIDKDCYLTFEVWGSKDGSDYVKLGYAEEIRSYLVAEFDVDITGYNYLKLTTYNTGISSVGASAVWADALVYCTGSSGTPSDPTDPTDPPKPDDELTDSGDVDTSTPLNYTASSDGTYTGVTKAAAGSFVDLSDAQYVGDSYILPSGGTPRYVRIDTTDLNANAPSKATIGKANASFSEHLTLHPTEKTNKTYSFVELDLTGLEVDRFYSAVGISALKGKTGNMGVIFNVFGYDETKADYVLIGTSSDVHGYESGEFDIDITGYKKLKLEVALTADSVDYYSRTSSWCNVGVYKYDEENGTAPEAPDDDQLPGVYTPAAGGKFQWITNVKDGDVYYLSNRAYTEASNNNGNPTTNNYPYGEANKKIIIGEQNTRFTYGLGVHPKSGASQSWTIYDVSGMDVDRFYAAVGITNEKGKAGSSEGVIFKVYVDYTGSGTYTQLAESEIIKNKMTGEFHVDISGARSLKLVVNSATGNHASSASTWAAACVYKYDVNGSTPVSYTANGASNATAKASDNTGLKPIAGFIPSDDGEYVGLGDEYSRGLIWLSSLTYTDASNTTNSAHPNGQPTSLDYPYNSPTGIIILGDADRAFHRGLGVHPKNPSAPVNGTIQSWTTYDLTGLDVDRFYSAVGITNDKGKEGASKGVIFRVYADYEGNGNFKELSHSGCLTGRESGEFDLDITGVKTLKLVVEAASSTHASSASAWANACVYNSKNTYEGVGMPEIREPSHVPQQDPTEPIVDATEPVEEAPTTDDGQITLPMGAVIAAAGALLLLLIALIVLLLTKRKKSGK